MASRLRHAWMRPKKFVRTLLIVCCLVTVWCVYTQPSRQPWLYILHATGVEQIPSLSCDRCNKWNFSFPIWKTWACSREQTIDLIVVVVSRPQNFLHRQTIRETWGSITEQSGFQMRTVFLVGMVNNSTINHQVKLESSSHQDIAQIALAESYTKLPVKSVALLHWVTKYCSAFQYVMKTDDDSYNDLTKFAKFLAEKERSVDLVAGFCFSVLPDRRKKSKWYVPSEVYPYVYFPTYCAGPAYVLSKSAATKIMNIAPYVTLLPLEDVYLTGVCRREAGIHEPVQIPGVLSPISRNSSFDIATRVANMHLQKNAIAKMKTLWKYATANK